MKYKLWYIILTLSIISLIAAFSYVIGLEIGHSRAIASCKKLVELQLFEYSVTPYNIPSDTIYDTAIWETPDTIFFVDSMYSDSLLLNYYYFHERTIENALWLKD